MAQFTFDPTVAEERVAAQMVINSFGSGQEAAPSEELVEYIAVNTEDAPFEMAPTPVPAATEAPPTPTPVPTPTNAAPAPASTPVTRDEIQTQVLEFLSKFPNKQDQVKHRDAILTCLKEDTGCERLNEVPDDKLDTAAAAVQSYVDSVV